LEAFDFESKPEKRDAITAPASKLVEIPSFDLIALAFVIA
jgi:hypothetical protein